MTPFNIPKRLSYDKKESYSSHYFLWCLHIISNIFFYQMYSSTWWSYKFIHLITLYLVRTRFSKFEPVTCKILTFLPNNTGIKLKTMHALGIYEKVGQVTKILYIGRLIQVVETKAWQIYAFRRGQNHLPDSAPIVHRWQREGHLWLSFPGFHVIV